MSITSSGETRKLTDREVEQIRRYYSGYVTGEAFAQKATREQIEFMVGLRDEQARLYNRLARVETEICWLHHRVTGEILKDGLVTRPLHAFEAQAKAGKPRGNP